MDVTHASHCKLIIYLRKSTFTYLLEIVIVIYLRIAPYLILIGSKTEIKNQEATARAE